MYEYQAQVTEIVDGDTIVVTVDLGFNMRRDIRLRLKGVDTDEIFGVDHDSAEYQRGIEQKQFVEQWCDVDTEYKWPFIVSTKKKGKFGRYLATVRRKSDDKELTQSLKENYDNIEY